MADDPEMELYQRLTDLLGTRDVHPEHRVQIRDAYSHASTWDALPQDIRDLIVELEGLPLQAWDDPSDIPDDPDDQD